MQTLSYAVAVASFLLVFVLINLCHGSLYFFDFDGNEKFAYVPMSLTNSIGMSDFSIQTWFRISSCNGESMTFFSTRPHDPFNDKAGLMTSFSCDESIPFIRLDDVDRIATRRPVQYDDNEWHNFIVTRESDLLLLYVDAEVIFTKTDETIGSANLSVGATSVALIGTDVESSKHMVGYLDDVAVWNRALNQTEIRFLQNNSLLTNCSYLWNDLLHYWNFNGIYQDPDTGQWKVRDAARRMDAILGAGASNYEPAVVFNQEPAFLNPVDACGADDLQEIQTTAHVGHAPYQTTEKEDSEQESQESQKSGDSDSTLVTVVAVVGSVLCVLLAVVGIRLVRHRKRKQSEDHRCQMMHTGGPETRESHAVQVIPDQNEVIRGKQNEDVMTDSVVPGTNKPNAPITDEP